jgi:hypothetical protein
MARAKRTPLTADEREGIVLAVNSAFRKLKNLYALSCVFEDFGSRPVSLPPNRLPRIHHRSPSSNTGPPGIV